jgi:hypothetical protein
MLQLFNSALIPLELCQVLPGQKVRNHIPLPNILELEESILNFSRGGPRSRLESIRNSIGVCSRVYFGQSANDPPEGVGTWPIRIRL